jgi:hypothetical protein
MVATSQRFVKGDKLLFLARVAAVWHCRPSQLLGLGMAEAGALDALTGGLTDGGMSAVTALQIDIAAAMALWQSAPRTPGEPEARELWW